MTGKEEIAKKGYMEGKFVLGVGKAHKCCSPHTAIFNCQMIGTFNIFLKTGELTEFEPVIKAEKKSYWFVKLVKKGEFRYGWAIKDHKSMQGTKTIELLTKERIPDRFKTGRFGVVVLEKWGNEKIREWASEQHWFQTFPFSPQKRADSEFVWNTIDRIDWSHQTVLDIGVHHGFFSFKASEAGGIVTGLEPNEKSMGIAKVIQENILMQDVKFVKTRTIPGDRFDIILYLSVLHQQDPNYQELKKKIQELKFLARKHLFVELIMPPLFPKDGKLTEEKIDNIVGGEILVRYRHKVRGDRKIYWWKRGD